MCAQCMVAVATAGGGAAGLRAWLASRRPAWLDGRRLGAASAVLLVGAALVASIQL